MDTKKCCRCCKTKPVSEFYSNTRTPDGLRHACKDCTRTIRRDSYARTYVRRTPPKAFERVVCPLGYKQCSHCGEVKAVEDFHRDRWRPDGHCHNCKRCACAMSRRSQHKPIEQLVIKRHRIPVPPDHKWCSRCETTKPHADFYHASNRRDGLCNWCKKCTNLYESNRKTVGSKAKNHAYALGWKFNITAADYERMLAQQDGVCAICCQPEKAKDRRNLAVDHDHKTGDIRGLLCGNCNKGIGNFQDDPALLERAIAYLLRPRSASAGAVAELPLAVSE